MTPRELVPVAADWAAVLLASGAEIRQVEEGLYDLFACHGHQAEVFVLLKGVFLSAWVPGEPRETLIRHVRGLSGVDLARLEEAVQLQDSLRNPATEWAQARKQVDALMLPPPRKNIVIVGAAAATAGIYGLFFGGTLWEAGWATVLGIVVQTLRVLTRRWKVPPLADAFVASALLAAGALGASLAMPSCEPVRILTGGVMMLIPGVALVNGIRDILHGDTVSSLYRLAEAGLQTAAIAAGTALVLTWGWPHG